MWRHQSSNGGRGHWQNSPWLQIIKDIHRIHKAELERIKDDVKRYDRLVELNVIEQAENVGRWICVQALKEHQNIRKSMAGCLICVPGK